ncbi:MAG: hypothetical protein WAZ19_02410 [Anaerolineae bacterium]
MTKVECIDDSGRNEIIPASKWVKKGGVYHIINSYKDMRGVELVELHEIDLKPYPPFKGFVAARFKTLEDGGGDELVEELIKELELELT